MEPCNCNRCGKAFEENPHLHQHKEKHRLFNDVKNKESKEDGTIRKLCTALTKRNIIKVRKNRKETADSDCAMCKRNFATNSGLDKHLNAKHESKKCPLWDDNFASKIELVNHINCCMYVKCHKCSKYFDRCGLRSCNENRGYKKQKNTLVCNKCDAIWISIPDIRKHIIEDHGEEGFKVRGPANFQS